MIGLSHPSPYDAVDLSNNVVMFDIPPPLQCAAPSTNLKELLEIASGQLRYYRYQPFAEVQDPPPLQINNKLPISDIAELPCGETITQAEKNHLFEMDLKITGVPDKHNSPSKGVVWENSSVESDPIPQHSHEGARLVVPGSRGGLTDHLDKLPHNQVPVSVTGQEVVGTLVHMDIEIMITVNHCLPVRGASEDPMCEDHIRTQDGLLASIPAHNNVVPVLSDGLRHSPLSEMAEIAVPKKDIQEKVVKPGQCLPVRGAVPYNPQGTIREKRSSEDGSHRSFIVEKDDPLKCNISHFLNLKIKHSSQIPKNLTDNF